MDLVINRPLKAEIHRLYLSWLYTTVSKTNITTLSSPTEEMMIDWVHKSMNVVTPGLMLKSFESAGITGSLRGLHN